ncbi:hypothetical protein T07_12264 [Trichinella nelsoni]|uniref:Uncharacterized protein n=1 Tax=Trichinella nelsoni TaxID=6336 RepID=A0A0V0SDV0_9BILA|nr:hypothetical protein T07_12264 [Trichinella nelsoni]
MEKRLLCKSKLASDFGSCCQTKVEPKKRFSTLTPAPYCLPISIQERVRQTSWPPLNSLLG